MTFRFFKFEKNLREINNYVNSYFEIVRRANNLRYELQTHYLFPTVTTVGG